MKQANKALQNELAARGICAKKYTYHSCLSLFLLRANEMKMLFATTALFTLVACDDGAKKAHQAPPPSESSIDYPDHFDGAWVMPSDWFGIMGVAIALSEDRYFYWMYSDIPDEASYPYTGTFRIQGEELILDAPFVLATGEPASNDPEVGLYSDRWKILPTGVSLRLHAATDKAGDHARTLIPDFQFDPTNPFQNQQNLKPEPGGSP